MSEHAEETRELPRSSPPGHTRVYDRDGVPQDMLTANAFDVVQHLGWSFANEGLKALAKKQKVVVVVSKKDASVTASNPQLADQVDLDTLSDDELRAFVKEHFEMNFNADVSRKDIMDAVAQEQSTG